MLKYIWQLWGIKIEAKFAEQISCEKTLNKLGQMYFNWHYRHFDKLSTSHMSKVYHKSFTLDYFSQEMNKKIPSENGCSCINLRHWETIINLIEYRKNVLTILMDSFWKTLKQRFSEYRLSKYMCNSCVLCYLYSMSILKSILATYRFLIIKAW